MYGKHTALKKKMAEKKHKMHEKKESKAHEMKEHMGKKHNPY